MDRWLPVLVALGGIAAQGMAVARWAGTVEERLGSVQEIARAAVPRNEFTLRSNTRDQELADIKAIVRDTNNKLDALIAQRLAARERQ